METESILCANKSESLIIAEKQHEKETNVAQKIQEECDKKFNNGEHEDETKITSDEHGFNNGNDNIASTVQETPPITVSVTTIQNGNDLHEKENQEEAEEEVPLDSLNVNPSIDNKNEVVTEEKIESLDEVERETEDGVAVVTEIQTNQDETAPENPIQEMKENKIEENVTPTATPLPVVVVDLVEVELNENKEIQQFEEEEESPRVRVIEEEMKAQRETLSNGPRKGAIATSIDTESVRDAYNDIRADNSETRWGVFKYEASRIVCSAKGVSFEEFKEQFDDDERAYGYIRLQTGDEMSKRHKFLFVTWIGPGVSVLKRAKMSIDKAIIKNVVSNFAVELQLETLSEFELPFFIESLNKASGANYGTGVRDI